MMKHKWSAWLLALALCLGLAVPALAQDSDFEIEDGVLTQYRGTDEDVVIPDGVTGIARDTFAILPDSSNREMSTITIPASVTNIEEGVFWSCKNLNAIHVDEDNPAYTDVDGVLFSRDMTLLHTCPNKKQDSTYTIPDGVTRIAEHAFYDCDSLTAVSIPESVTSIGEGAFVWCGSLTAVTIPESVTDIGACAFLGCKSLTDVTVPESVTTIGTGAFSWSPWQKSLGEFPVVNGILLDYQGDGGDVVVPDGVTEIAEDVFFGLDKLTSVTFPNTLKSIGKEVFYECNSLTEISIPASVTSIGPGAFSGCDSLTAVHVEAGNPNYCDVDGVLFSRDGTLLHTYPAGKPTGPYTIPDGVTHIGAWAFDDCKGLTAVTIPNSVVFIGEEAFIACTGLTEVTIPDSVTEIADGMFDMCDNLTSVTIPVSVTSIGGWAFDRCENLSDVYYGGSEEQWKAIEIGQYNSGLTNATIHYNSVPEPTPTPPPSTPVTPSTPAPVEVKQFSDVKDTDYFAAAVEWAAGKNIAAGTTDTTFSPNAACTTAQILTFLWRAEGSPTPTVENPFSDVDGSDYYYKAALWAFEKELVSGPVFGGDTPCTRSQAVTCLWKLAGKPQADAVNFTDVSASVDYAPAVAWAAQTGVTCGTSDTTFSPSEVCTRGQIVTFLYRDLK